MPNSDSEPSSISTIQDGYSMYQHESFNAATPKQAPSPPPLPPPPKKPKEFANPSVFLYGPGDAKIEDRPEPRITEPTDAIVRIKFVGVCGSDVCPAIFNWIPPSPLHRSFSLAVPSIPYSPTRHLPLLART